LFDVIAYPHELTSNAAILPSHVSLLLARPASNVRFFAVNPLSTFREIFVVSTRRPSVRASFEKFKDVGGSFWIGFSRCLHQEILGRTVLAVGVCVTSCVALVIEAQRTGSAPVVFIKSLEGSSGVIVGGTPKEILESDRECSGIEYKRLVSISNTRSLPEVHAMFVSAGPVANVVSVDTFSTNELGSIIDQSSTPQFTKTVDPLLWVVEEFASRSNARSSDRVLAMFVNLEPVPSVGTVVTSVKEITGEWL
jgi:hypothetical protein